ncbi:hypothetical protein WJX72_010902 [[Myrmecia] bisecta]|uniref:ATP synthase mitochondrial F1 complex assembly factor 1 n=1 Tax=[Myrmecia] bisecta TaxID=41462 RepID=A0AAW1QGB6_9CHLO
MLGRALREAARSLRVYPSATTTLLAPFQSNCTDILKHRSFSAAVTPSPAALGDLLKLDAIQHLHGDQIIEVWTEYHTADDSRLAGSLLPEDYAKFAARAAASPLFVLPLKRPAGNVVNFLLQCQLPRILVTTLEDYRMFSTTAPSHFTITHYTELQNSHGVVLIRGDMNSPAIISSPEARTLMGLTYAFYSDPQSYLHVHNFNHDTGRFDYQKLLADLGHEPASQP